MVHEEASSLFESELLSTFLIYVEHDGILLSEATHSDDIKLRVPVHITNRVHQRAFEMPSCLHFFSPAENLPDMWSAILTSRDQVLPVRRDNRPHHHIFTFRPEESLSDFHALPPVLDKSDAVIAGMDHQLLAFVGFDRDVIDRIAFQVRMLDRPHLLRVQRASLQRHRPFMDRAA